MKKLIFILMLFSSFSLFAETGKVAVEGTVGTSGSNASTTLTLNTASDASQYVEIGFIENSLTHNDFSTDLTPISGGITLVPSAEGTASYGGESNNFYAYYRIHHTGNVTITIKTEELSGGSGSTGTINTMVSGKKKTADGSEGEGFSSGEVSSGDVTYSPAVIYQQTSATSPVADSVALTVNTENYLSKPSGIYTGDIILTVTADSGN